MAMLIQNILQAERIHPRYTVGDTWVSEQHSQTGEVTEEKALFSKQLGSRENSNTLKWEKQCPDKLKKLN